MKTTFDINRFYNLMRYEVLSESRNFLLGLLGLTMGMTFYFCFIFYSIKDGASYTTSSSVPVKITFEAALSGVVTVQLTGDITAQPAHSLTAEEISAGEVTLNVELTALAAEGEEEGATRTVTATVTDAVGNVSDSKDDSFELDTVVPTRALSVTYTNLPLPTNTER